MATETTTTGLTPADIDKAKAAATAETTKAVTAMAADIVDICAAAGVPTMASALIRESVTVDQAKARTDSAKDIRAAVDLARKSCPQIEANAADAFIAAGMSMDAVRAKLFEQITAAQSPEITSAHQSTTGAADEATAEAAKVVAAFAGANTNTKKGSAA